MSGGEPTQDGFRLDGFREGGPGVWRQRMYCIPEPRASQVPSGPQTWRRRRYSASAEVVLSGQLQVKSFGLFWIWRWCVLDEEELRFYRNEAHALASPSHPVKIISVERLVASTSGGASRGPAGGRSGAEGGDAPMVIRLTDHADDALLAELRPGGSQRWEEYVAMKLWVQALRATGGARRAEA